MRLTASIFGVNAGDITMLQNNVDCYQLEKGSLLSILLCHQLEVPDSFSLMYRYTDQFSLDRVNEIN